jgi:acetyltransferase-like isoleucine patch superfamily enzyme
MRRKKRRLEPEAVVDDGVLINYPCGQEVQSGPIIGQRARLRSGTVLYAGARIGSDFETGHNVVVREDTHIGDHVSIWSNTIIDYGTIIGNCVKIHANCYIAQFSTLEDEVFLAPGVVIANDLYPGCEESAKVMSGPRIERGAQIGVNSTILPYVTIGEGAIIGAGAVVTRDIPGRVVAYGSPATPRTTVDRLMDIRARVEEAGTQGRRYRFKSAQTTKEGSLNAEDKQG